MQCVSEYVFFSFIDGLFLTPCRHNKHHFENSTILSVVKSDELNMKKSVYENFPKIERTAD